VNDHGVSALALDGRTVLLRVRGDAPSIRNELRAAMRTAVATGHRGLIVELSGAGTITGAIAWELSRANERLRWRGGHVIVVSDAATLEPLFDAFALHSAPAVVTTLDDALTAARIGVAGRVLAHDTPCETSTAPAPGPPVAGAEEEGSAVTLRAPEEAGTGTFLPEAGRGLAAGASRMHAPVAKLPLARRHPDRPRQHDFDIRGGAGAPALARAAFGRVVLAETGEGECAHGALLVSEAVTNSVVHGGASDERDTIALRVSFAAGGVTVVVSDPNDGFVPPPRSVDEPRPGGRGLPLIHSLARAWGVEPAPGGGIWFELARAVSAEAIAVPAPVAAAAPAGG
jgi:anti-sigma regulatory factor (Ser/Thr protein kinase)